jgi:DNA gyrase/topoisomerase IV subunit B
MNPVFDTQTKENLTSKLNGNVKDFTLSEGLLKRLSKDDMFSDLIELSLMKEKMDAEKELNKQITKRIRIDNLVDANKAGTTESSKCQLFLTEGLSASASAISGFSIIGRDYNGSYPLKGKPLNVKNVPLKKVSENDEIKNLIQILGLEFGKKYKDTKSLRYGKIVMMTDADCIDGNTLIKTLNGNKMIKDITYLDKVLTHSGKYKSILNIIETNKDKYIEITINSEKLKLGEYHKIPVYRNNKVEIVFAKDILKTDFLLVKK